MRYTAVGRKFPSAPVRYLFENSLLVGKCLDYGCGRGFDADFFGMDKYDPYSESWSNISLDTPKRYNTIVCIYVFDIVMVEEEESILKTIQSLLEPNGVAYIAVARDFNKHHLHKGTIKRRVNLPLESIYHKKHSFEIYKMGKSTILPEFGS